MATLSVRPSLAERLRRSARRSAATPSWSSAATVRRSSYSAHVVCVAFDFHACLDLALAHDQEHDDACDGHQQEAEEQERLPLAEDVFLQLAVGQACGHGVVADFEFGQRLLHAARGQAVGPHHGGVAIGVRQVVVAETGIAVGDHAVGAVEWRCHAVVAGGEELIEGLAVVAVLHVVADAH